MSLSMLLLLLLLLLACSTQASHFLGTVMTYYPKNTNSNGSVTVGLRYKTNFHSCASTLNWLCKSVDCGSESSQLYDVDMESSGEWCQREGVTTRLVSSNAPFELRIDSGNWISNIVNGIVRWRAATLVELRNRSDTGQANRSPQTTILPAVRVPSNCQRDFNLLMFDPDEDEVKCRYGNASLMECESCTTPPQSVLNLSSSCTLSFSPTNSSNEGPYAMQLVMEDFPRQTINLTQTDGQMTTITTDDAISKIPVQFVLRVDSVVPSCTEGLYLPKFLPPTPANRARLYTPVNQTLEIIVNAEANISTISELLFSGPYNTNKSTSGLGQFILSWTPSVDENGESHPICFVIQAVNIGTKYHSDLRCVIVSVGNATVTTTPTTTTQSTTTIPFTTTQLNSTTNATTTTTTTPPTTTPTATTSTQSPTNYSTTNTTASTYSSTTVTTTPTTTTQSTTTVPSTTTQLNSTTNATTTTTTTPPTTTPTTTTSTQSPTNSTVTTTPTTTTQNTTTVPSTTTQVNSTTNATTTTTTTTPPTTTETTITTPTVTPMQITTVTSTTTPMATRSTQSPLNYVIGLKVRISSLFPPSEEYLNNILQQLGLPAHFSLRIVNITSV